MSSSLTFAAPFRLKGIDGVQPAGTYQMDTDEESLDVLSRIAFRRVATYIHVQRKGVSQVVTVEPAELEVLLREGVLTPLD